MTRRLRALAVLAGLMISAESCGSAEARSPAVSAADVADVSPPPPSPAPVASAPSPPLVPAAQVGRPIPTGHVRTYPYPVATLPGFEMLPDGGSRLFVEISRAVNVEERRTERVLTYILKGARVVYRNNENSLVTVHFNTPVTRARLLPSGRDLLFSVDLRADASPSWKMINESDGTATLQIVFPKGSFLPAGDVDETNYGGPRPAAASSPPGGGVPAPQPKPWRRGAQPSGPAAPPPPAPPANAQPSPN